MSGIGCFALRKKQNFPFIFLILIIFFLVIQSAALSISSNELQFGKPYSNSDDAIYVVTSDLIASALSIGDFRGALDVSRINQPGYVWLLGGMFYIFQADNAIDQVLIAIALNAFFLSLIILLAVNYSLERGCKKLLIFILLIFICQDSVISIAAVVRKDLIIEFLVMAIYLSSIKLKNYKSFRNILILLVLLFFLGLFRLSVGLIFILLTFLYYIYIQKKISIQSIVFAVAISLVAYGGYILNQSYTTLGASLVEIPGGQYSSYELMGNSKIIYDLPFIGPALWYFVNPLFINISDIYSRYTLIQGTIILISSELFIWLAYFSIVSVVFSSKIRLMQFKGLLFMIFIILIILQFGGANAEPRHFSMAYPFLLLLCISYFSSAKSITS